MLLNIFNVDHGACAMVTTSNGRRVLIDCGHHAEERWLPGAALNSMGIYNIDRLFITNFDEDHCSGIGDLLSRVFVQALVTNDTITPQAVREMKSANGMGNGIRHLIESMERTFTGGPVSAVDDANFGDASFSIFRNPYDPYFGFSDTNNLSLTIFIRCGPHKIVFPGDLEVQGWKTLMQNPAFARELRDVTLFVASHHGRLNGYSREVMEACPNIQAVIFSDDGIAYQTQETVDLYRQHASGIIFDGKLRRVLTTRRDRSMIFHLNEAGGGTVSLNVAA